MASIESWEFEVQGEELRKSYPVMRGYKEDSSCFLCGETLGGPCVYWAGIGPDQEYIVVLHSRCALDMSAGLATDAYEAETRLSIPRIKNRGRLLECMGNNWRRRLDDEQLAAREAKSQKADESRPSIKLVVLRDSALGDPSGSSVYFVQQGGSGPIKIGVSRDVQGRLAQLQTSSAHSLRLLGSISGGASLEADLHKQFKDDRLQGEWFAPSAQLVDFIETLIAIVDRSNA